MSRVVGTTDLLYTSRGSNYHPQEASGIRRVFFSHTKITFVDEVLLGHHLSAGGLLVFLPTCVTSHAWLQSYFEALLHSLWYATEPSILKCGIK